MKDSWFKRFVKMMTNNLAGVPSIVFRLSACRFVCEYTGVRRFHPGRLPYPQPAGIACRHPGNGGSLAGGRSIVPAGRPGTWRDQTADPSGRVVLPIATPNIITGLILSVGRVSGETASILSTVAAYSCLNCLHVFNKVMALPYHLYVISTSGTDIQASRDMAYGTALMCWS